MKFLCLIRAEKVMEQMPKAEADADAHFEEYRRFTEEIRWRRRSRASAL